MVNNSLSAILMASALVTPVFAQNKPNTQTAASKEPYILNISNLTQQDYRFLTEEEQLNIRGSPNEAVKVYTKKSGLKQPEYYMLRTGNKVQIYYPSKK